MKKQVLLLFIGLLVSNITFADDNPRLTRCMEVSGGTTIGMIECYGEETNYQDKLLNEFYQKVKRAITPERQQALRDTQRIWIKWRDVNCSFYYDPDGGSMARVMASRCVMQITTDRVKELEMFEGLY